MYDNSTGSDRRNAFSDGDIATASPARVLVKCFDRLDADLDRGLTAIRAGHHEAANRELGHAQDLLGEVAGMLDIEAWEHAGSLLAVYDYVLRLLAVGSMLKDPAPVVEARHLLAELGESFRVAATSDPILEPAAAPASPSPPSRTGGFSVLA